MLAWLLYLIRLTSDYHTSKSKPVLFLHRLAAALI